MTCPRCDRPLLRDGTCLTHGEPSYAPVSMPITTRTPRPKWTPEERAILRAAANDPTITGPELARRLGRPHKGLKHQLARLGLSKVRAKSAPRKARTWATARPRGRWTDDEVTALEAGDLTILYRARGKWAVVAKAKREGCPVRSGDGCYSVRQVAEHYRLRPNTVCDWIGRGLLPARRSGRMWRIEPSVADRVIPILKRATRANNGRKEWWTK